MNEIMITELVAGLQSIYGKVLVQVVLYGSVAKNTATQELAVYRYEKAKEDLDTARMNHNNSMCKAAINRSYYAMFHGMRSVTILDGYDSSKHSGIIAFFNQIYIKNGIR